jgi:hypothetical protein
VVCWVAVMILRCYCSILNRTTAMSSCELQVISID